VGAEASPAPRGTLAFTAGARPRYRGGVSRVRNFTASGRVLWALCLAGCVNGLGGCGDDTSDDVGHWTVSVQGRLRVGPLIDPPKSGWIWASVSPATVKFRTLACENLGAPPYLTPVEFYTSTTSPSFSQYGLTETTPNYPRLHTYVALREGVPGNRGGGPFARGTRYGESATIDLEPCPEGAPYPSAWPACYTGTALADVVIDQVFEGCD
jgi:hypothetical protein